jgi:hypothetical protein
LNNKNLVTVFSVKILDSLSGECEEYSFLECDAIVSEEPVVYVFRVEHFDLEN